LERSGRLRTNFREIFGAVRFSPFSTVSALSGQPAREIARLIGLPVENVHKLAQKVKKQLREEIGGADAVKKWKLSV
jgi:hypothetical protein